MLRLTLLALLIANAGYLAWTQGWMATLGWAPEVQSESYRIRQQVRPDVLTVLPPATADSTPAEPVTSTPPRTEPTSVVAAPPVATSPETPTAPEEEVLPQATICLQTSTMDTSQARPLQAALQNSALPSHSWEQRTHSQAGRWMVYLGKFPNEMAMEKRRAELRTRKIAFDRAGGSLEPGLSLGRFSTEEAATRELTHMLNQGIRGARVVQERAAQTNYSLRFAQLTAAQHTQLKTLHPAFAGKALQPCSGD